jgi:HD-GYP domain-containing protein (c-di-GMP phosphodiesterase class II)
VIAQTIRTGRAQNVPDVRAVFNYIPGWDIAQSELAIPLRVGGSVIGAIDVQSSNLNAFTSDDERIMTIFAERAALALEHGRLNAQTETRMRQLISMRTVDMAISSSFDLDPVMTILLDQVTRQLGVHAADALTYDGSTQTFLFICGRGFRRDVQHHTRLWLGESLAGRVAQERQTIHIPNLLEQPGISSRFPDIFFEQFVTYVGVPLIAKGQLKGVLEIFHREPLEFGQDEYRFLEMLASQLAIAIDNTELFENLQRTNADLMIAYDSTLEGWAKALELRDKETEGHSRHVSWLAIQLAQAMKVKEEDLVHIYRGAVLHDIGKMGVPDSIILKPGPLTEAEMAVVRKHPEFAYTLLLPINYLRLAIDIPYCHHEKWDGTGYPRGLQGEQIPLAARIFAVVDVWDALISDRPFRKAWSREDAARYIREQAGIHFDPAVAGAFLNSTFKDTVRY